MKRTLFLLAFFTALMLNAQSPFPSGIRLPNATKSDTISDDTRIPIMQANSGNLINKYVPIEDLGAYVDGVLWGSITGTLSNQTDLQNALNLKVDVAGDTMTGDLKIESNLEVINDPLDTAGVLNVANFAGQTNYGSEPIGVVFHHYTDGNQIQVDNVGEGNDILVLKNARNPSRRTDKPIDFFGTGNFLRLMTQETTDPSDMKLVITKDAEFVFGNTVNPEFITDKDNSGYGFIFTSYKDLTYPLAFRKMGDVFLEMADDGNRTTLRTTTNRINGLDIGAQDGELRLLTAGVPHIFVLENGNVGIGSNTPLNKLTVSGTVGASGIVSSAPNSQLILVETDMSNKEYAVQVSSGQLRITETGILDRLVIDGGNTTITGNLTATKYAVSALNTPPATATSTGVTGDIRYTATHIYVCIATNTWVRAALTTW